MKTKMRIGIAVGAVLAVIAISVASFFVINYGWWLAEIPAADAKLVNPGYLKIRIGNSMEESKLLLVSATARYGTYHGQDCFIINVTIRSDYTPQNPAPGGGIDFLGSAFFGVTAKLYHENRTIDADDVTGRLVPLGVPQYALAHGETGWFEIDMATLNRNIDNYSIMLLSVSNNAVP